MTQLTAKQAKVTGRVIQFSLLSNIVKRLIPAFPSCTFECVCRDSGCTEDWKVTGPAVWVDKIERRYGY